MPAPAGSSPATSTNVNGTLFFTRQRRHDRHRAVEERRDRGRDRARQGHRPGVGGFSAVVPTHLTDVNGTLFFTASDGTTGAELWKSDGTAAGTVLVKDIAPAAMQLRPEQRSTNVNGTLFFTADDGTHRRRAVEERRDRGRHRAGQGHRPAAAQLESRRASTNVNGTLFFTADDGTNGRELWKSDGTAAGTAPVRDINPERGSSEPSRPDQRERRRSSSPPTTARTAASCGRATGRPPAPSSSTTFGLVADGSFSDPTIPGALSRYRPHAIRDPLPQADDGVHRLRAWGLNLDSDGDGLFDRDELALGTDPLDADSDDDAVSDGARGRGGTRPLDPGRFPVAQARVEVVGPGNLADGNGLGAVAYEYPISQHEVTVREYVSFLNAVADTDTYGLFEETPAAYASYRHSAQRQPRQPSPTAPHPVEPARA